MRKVGLIALQKEAAAAARHAEAVGTGGISSDDPDAIVKLKAQLATLESKQERMIAVNKLVGKFKNDKAAGVAELVKLGLHEKHAAALFEPDFCGRTRVCVLQADKQRRQHPADQAAHRDLDAGRELGNHARGARRRLHDRAECRSEPGADLLPDQTLRGDPRQAEWTGLPLVAHRGRLAAALMFVRGLLDARAVERGDVVTAKQYRAALKRLNLTIAGGAPKVLGIGPRQSQRMAAGDAPVPEPVARLLRLIIRLGIDPAEVK